MSFLSKFLAKVAPDHMLSHTLFPPPSKFDPARDMPDLNGKTVIVTGGNTGIGYQTVRQLLLKNANVYLAARSLGKCEEASQALQKDTGRVPVQLELDLSDLHSVKRAAQEFLNKEEKLDILFNNAGVMNPPIEQLTTQGYDLQFGVNLLGHYYFTMLLLPALEHSTYVNGIKARVVNTSSSGHSYAVGDEMLYSVFKGGPERDAKVKEWGLSTSPGHGAQSYLYGFSKMGTIMFTHLLNRHYDKTISSWTLHPGGIYTDLQRHGSAFEKVLVKRILWPAPWGALNQLWAGTMPEAENDVGAYLIPWARAGKADPRAASEREQDKLWEYLAQQVKPFEEPIRNGDL